MVKIKAQELILEVTRKCNMHCFNCPKGDAQNQNMSEKVLKRIFDLFSEINQIIYTGGEPSLNTDIMQKSIDIMRREDIRPDSFVVFTNGDGRMNDLLKICDQLYAWCGQYEWPRLNHKEAMRTARLLCRDDLVIGGLALRINEYHNPIPYENILKLTSRRYFIQSSLQDSKRPFSKPKNLDGTIEDGLYTVYVNVHGDILSDPNIEYLKQPKFKFGNIFDPDIEQKLGQVLK